MSDTSNTNEYELARRARQGDAEALGLLIEQNRERLFALAYAELRHYADAQDAVASALLNICIHIRSLRQPERMHAWMNSIVRNEARRLRRGPEAPLRLDDFPHESLASDTLQAVLRDAEITQALDRLSPNQAQAIQLFYFGQLSIREIALRSGHSEGTVKSWLHYGRQRLAAAMKEESSMTHPSALPNTADPSIAELLKNYSKQFDKDPLTADYNLLAHTRERLKAEIQRRPLSSELVRLAMAIHWNWAADPAFLAPMLAAYLQQSLTVEEEVWAREEYVNILTVLKQSAEVVKNQRASLRWAREQWEAGRITSEQWLHLISNSGQAEQWTNLGIQDEWIALFNDMMAVIPPTAENRMERFYTLRTACLMVQAADEHKTAFVITEQIRALAEEDISWDKAYEMRVQADCAAMRLYAAEGKTEKFLTLGMHAITLLEEQRRRVAEMTKEGRIRLLIQYDNVACLLYFQRQYALSIPLHRYVLELGYNQEYVYKWLAASVWAYNGDRARALELLRQGRARARSLEEYQADFAELPEFQGVLEAPDFMEAITVPSP